MAKHKHCLVGKKITFENEHEQPSHRNSLVAFAVVPQTTNLFSIFQFPNSNLTGPRECDV